MSWRSRPESILRWLVGDADVAAEVALITGFGAFGHIGSMQSDAVRRLREDPTLRTLGNQISLLRTSEDPTLGR